MNGGGGHEEPGDTRAVLRVASVNSWTDFCMQGMTTHFKPNKTLKCLDFGIVLPGQVKKEAGENAPTSATTSWWPCRCGTQPAPARADQRGRGQTETAPANPQEPGLRCQLPHQTCHPERGAGEAEDRAAMEVDKLARENASMRLELDALRAKYEALQCFARTVTRGPLSPGKVATTSVITIVKSANHNNTNSSAPFSAPS
ncbi:hypothetical protein WMY93_003871 [Mugilogobius chulae]|uniref:Uncharacterized protein n=1 Tax=Mugilogobius chulae TaxID=88201 RepID=A0AAW0PZG2_9GOBI